MHVFKLVAAELLDPDSIRLAHALYRLWRKHYRPTKAPPKPPAPPPAPKPRLTCGCYTSIQGISDTWAMTNARRAVLNDWKVAVCSDAWLEILADYASSQRYVHYGQPKVGASLFLRGGMIEVFEAPLLHRTKDRQ